VLTIDPTHITSPDGIVLGQGERHEHAHQDRAAMALAVAFTQKSANTPTHHHRPAAPPLRAAGRSSFGRLCVRRLPTKPPGSAACGLFVALSCSRRPDTALDISDCDEDTFPGLGEVCGEAGPIADALRIPVRARAGVV
jgi:hypothetical protein